MNLSETDARKLLLVQAIDTADDRFSLLDALRRSSIDQEALAAVAGPGHQGDAVEPGRYLVERAERTLNALDARPYLQSLQEPGRWRRRLALAVPLAALALGVMADRVSYPDRVNMLAPPLLAIVLFNLCVYLVLLAGLFSRKAALATPLLELLHEWAPAWRRWRRLRPVGALQADIAGRFYMAWFRATGSLELQRLKQVLHWSAAAWALGLGLSIAIGGLVQRYNVGWSSTLLDPAQVHGVLRALFWPVVEVLRVDAFSPAEIERMAFAAGREASQADARRWVGLYLALLAIVVVVPRTLMALFAAWRARRMARAVSVDLDDDHFARVLARVNPVAIVLGLAWQQEEDRAALAHLFREDGGQTSAGTRPWLGTRRGDALSWRDMGAGAGEAGALPVDAVVVVVRDAVGLTAQAQWLNMAGRPVLVLSCAKVPAAGFADATAELRTPHRVLELNIASLSWVKEALLLSAVRPLLPPHKLDGFDLMALAQERRQTESLGRSMDRLVAMLADSVAALAAVREGGFFNRIRDKVVKPADAGETSLDEALGQLSVLRHAALIDLLELHGVDAACAQELQQRLRDGLQANDSVPAREIAAAAAASGAAAGAAVDVMVGGITLGAAAALGALLVGGTAYAAAWRKNRTNRDDVLLAVVEAALLLYVAAARRAATPPAMQLEDDVTHWRSETIATVAGHKDGLMHLLGDFEGKEPPGGRGKLAAEMAAVLGTMAVVILGKL